MSGVPLEPVGALTAGETCPSPWPAEWPDLSDVRALERLGCDVQIGMALYQGRLSLDDALLAIPAFDAGPVPTIAQGTDGRVLMLAWSTRESLREALALGRGVYWSRRREALWRKGDTSGHTQALLGVRYDCDADALLFTVDQRGAACHTNRSTCFGDVLSFRLEDARAHHRVSPRRGRRGPHGRPACWAIRRCFARRSWRRQPRSARPKPGPTSRGSWRTFSTTRWF